MTCLFREDSYETPSGVRRLPLARVLGWTRLPFYWYVLRAVFGGGAAASRGAFTTAEFMCRSEQVVRAVEGCGGRLLVTGMEHLAEVPGPLVIIGNHMSFLETFALPAMILARKPVSFVIKRSLLTYPGLGAILRSQDPVALTRTSPRDDLRVMLEEGAKRLASGRSLCVFPQSTRRADFVAARFGSLGTKLAQRAGRPILPVAVRTDFVGNGMLIKDFGPIRTDRVVRFAFGAPIDSADARQAQQQAVEFIASHLTAWGVPCS